MLIGLNFDLKKLMMTGEQGRVEVPINQFGGRFGVLGDPATYMSHDDGTRVAGGLNLVVTYQKTGGVYTLDVQIEHGAKAIGFGEETVTEETVTEETAHDESHKENPFHKVLTAHGYSYHSTYHSPKMRDPSDKRSSVTQHTHTYKHPLRHDIDVIEHRYSTKGKPSSFMSQSHGVAHNPIGHSPKDLHRELGGREETLPESVDLKKK
jgi:hypothetical protein